VRDQKRHRLVPLDAVGDVPNRDCSAELPEIDPAKLQLALNELDEAFRTPIILFYFEEFSYRDIAEQMELPIGTVMSRLARGKAYLRTRLQPAQPEEASVVPDRDSGPKSGPKISSKKVTDGVS
jgi:RNA polymerase sigma-70 factor (ECF subfamily)